MRVPTAIKATMVHRRRTEIGSFWACVGSARDAFADGYARLATSPVPTLDPSP